jgi:predicted nucleic acid-binding protein
MSDPLYLLDTNVMLFLMRGGALGQHINARFGLCTTRQRPLVCVVSHGEVWVLARRNGWGEEKQAALHNLLNNLVTVDINHPRVIQVYVELDLVSQAHPGGARNMGKNDLWIAAAAKATGATLLTTDGDFNPLIPDHLDGIIIDPKVAATRED